MDVPTRPRYLWDGTLRRNKARPSGGHEAALNATKLFLKTTPMTGYQAEGCSPWAEGQQKDRLNRLMGIAWEKVSLRMGSRPGQRDNDVRSEPEPLEAREVCAECLTFTLVNVGLAL